MKFRVNIVIILLFPILLFSQNLNDVNKQKNISLYNQECVYLKSNFWTGLKIVQNNKEYSMRKFRKELLIHHQDAYEEYEIFQKYRLVSSLLGFTASFTIGLMLNENTQRDIVPIYGAYSLGLLIASSSFSLASANHFYKAIWKYNRSVLNP